MTSTVELLYTMDANLLEAAAMTAKAGNINGLFRAKALIDIDCGASGARAYSDVLTKKNAANIADDPLFIS